MTLRKLRKRQQVLQRHGHDISGLPTSAILRLWLDMLAEMYHCRARAYAPEPMSIGKISSLTGMSDTALINDMRAAGIERRQRGGPNAQKGQKGIEMVWEGRKYPSRAALARALNIPMASFHKHRKNLKNYLEGKANGKKRPDARSDRSRRDMGGSRNPGRAVVSRSGRDAPLTCLECRGARFTSLESFLAVCRAKYHREALVKRNCTGCRYGRLAAAGQVSGFPAGVGRLT